jgi:predicted RNA polymerase sigma factor
MADDASDWAATTAGRLESLVSAVRSKTTDPVITTARAVVFGLVAGVLATFALLVGTIGVVRLLDVYLPFHPLERRVWVVDVAAAAIFLAAGAFLWTKRHPKAV